MSEVRVFPRGDRVEKCERNLIAPHLCVTSHTHTHTHHGHKQPRRMRVCALVELVGLARCQSYAPGSTVGRVVYHSMAAAAGAAVDVSAVTLAAYQQQQQRSMAVWYLIMDGYDDDTEIDAENMSPRGRSKGAVSISAKTIKYLVGGRSYRTKTVFDRFLEECEAYIYHRVFVQPQGFNVRHGACEAVCGLLSLSADGLLCVGSG